MCYTKLWCSLIYWERRNYPRVHHEQDEKYVICCERPNNRIPVLTGV